MKKVSLGVFLVIIFLQISCKKKEDPRPAFIIAPNHWTLGDHTYNRGNSTQQRSIMDNGDTLMAIRANATVEGDYGAFLGSGLGCSFIDQGEGEYTVVDQEIAMSDSSGKYMYFTCGIGTSGNAGANYYVSQPSTVKATVIKVSGQYQVTVIDPVLFKRYLMVNGGVTGASDAYMFTCKDIY